MSDIVQMPLWVVIGQWSLLLALGFLIIIAYRQLGYLLNLREVMSSAGTEKDGLAIGSKAPSFSYTSMNVSKGTSQYFVPQGNWSLLLIADPECASCRNALAALIKLESQLRGKMQLLVITTSESTFIEAVDEFRISSIEIGHVEREVVRELYLTHTTPFLYIIDAEGVIRAKRVSDDEADIKKTIREAERTHTRQYVVMQPVK